MKENSKAGVVNSILIQFILVGSLRGSLNRALVFIEPQGPQIPIFHNGVWPQETRKTHSVEKYTKQAG